MNSWKDFSKRSRTFWGHESLYEKDSKETRDVLKRESRERKVSMKEGLVPKQNLHRIFILIILKIELSYYVNLFF